MRLLAQPPAGGDDVLALRRMREELDLCLDLPGASATGTGMGATPGMGMGMGVNMGLDVAGGACIGSGVGMGLALGTTEVVALREGPGVERASIDSHRAPPSFSIWTTDEGAEAHEPGRESQREGSLSPECTDRVYGPMHSPPHHLASAWMPRAGAADIGIRLGSRRSSNVDAGASPPPPPLSPASPSECHSPGTPLLMLSPPSHGVSPHLLSPQSPRCPAAQGQHREQQTGGDPTEDEQQDMEGKADAQGQGRVGSPVPMVDIPSGLKTMGAAVDEDGVPAPYSWKEMEWSCRKLDDLSVTISQIDLSCMGDRGGNMPAWVQYNIEVQPAPTRNSAPQQRPHESAPSGRRGTGVGPTVPLKETEVVFATAQDSPTGERGLVRSPPVGKGKGMFGMKSRSLMAIGQEHTPGLFQDSSSPEARGSQHGKARTFSWKDADSVQAHGAGFSHRFGFSSLVRRKAQGEDGC